MSPSSDTKDNKVHFTPANLSNKFHRSIETASTVKILKAISPDNNYFVHHDPLSEGNYFSDEGAANHTRLYKEYHHKGIELFVYGKTAFGRNKKIPVKYPSRQTLEASETIARVHKLSADNVIFAQQNPDVIDAGVFHNYVISVGDQNVFFFHENAFVNKKELFSKILKKISTKNFIL